MHTQNHPFRFATEARLCRFADAPGATPEANLPKTEAPQPEGEAMIPPTAGDTPETLQKAVEDTADTKMEDLGKRIEDMGEVADSSKPKEDRAVPVPPEPAPADQPKSNEEAKNNTPDAAKPSAAESSKNSPEDRGTVMAEMKGQTEQLLQAVRDAEAKAEVEGYTPENIKAITAAIDAYIATAGKEQEYLRADDIQTDVDRQQSLDTEVSEQRARREELQKEPGATEAKADTKDNAQESGEKNLEQLTAKANEALESAKNILGALPESQNKAVPQMILSGRFEKVMGGKDQGGNRSAEDIILKSKATEATFRLLKNIGYNTKDYDAKTGNGVFTRRDGESVEIAGGEETSDLEELIPCKGMPLEEQVQSVTDAIEEIAMALSKEPDQKKIDARFDKAVKEGAFGMQILKEKPGEESWRTDAVLTDDVRNLFKDLPKDAQQTAIGRFMENANVRKDAAGNMFLSAKASMSLDFKTVTLFAASSVDIVERQDANGVPLEMGLKTNVVQLSTFLDGVRLRYTDKGSKNVQPDGRVIGDKMEKASDENKKDTSSNPDLKVGNELPLPQGLPKDIATKAQEMYATMSPEKQNAFRNAIVSMGTLAEDPNKVLSVASLLSKISDSISAKFDQRNPSFSKEDYTKLADMVSGLTPTEFDLFGSLVVVPGERLGSTLKSAGVSPADYESKLRELAGKASSSDAKGSAGNDKVSGGEPSPAKPDTPQSATSGDKGKDVPQPATPEAPNAAPPSTSEQAPAGAPEGAKNLQELRSKAAEIVGKINAVNREIAPLNAELQKLRGEKAAATAKGEDTAEMDQRISALEEQMKPLIEEKKALLEEAKGINDQLKEAKGDLPKDASSADVAKRKLEDMGDTFRDPNATGGEKLIAVIQAIGAVLALWREAINGTADKSPDAASDKKNNDPNRPADGGNSSPEKGAETQDARGQRVRKELKDSTTANTAQELIAEKRQTIEKQKDSLKGRIEKVDAETKGLKTEREGLQKKIEGKKEEIAKAKPEDREALQSELRMAEQDMKSLDERITARENESKSLTEKMNAAPKEMEADIQALEKIEKSLQLVKEGMDTILNQLKELKNPGVDKLVAGITVAIDAKNLDLAVTATASAQEELKTIDQNMKFDSMGKLEGKPEQFTNALIKLLSKMSDQPAATSDAPKPAAPDTSADIKGDMPKVIAGTLKDTMDVLEGRIARANLNLTDQKKDLAEVKSSWNPFRNGEQRNKERAVGMQEAALKVLRAKVDQLKAIPSDDPKKQLDGIMKIREELGLPKVPQEFAKDYDTFQKMAAEGVDKKDKSTEVDYAALNKELQEVDATLANVEMGIKALDTGMSIASSAVPGGNFVYNLARNGTGVLTGEMSPNAAATNVVVGAILGKGGKALMATKQGAALVEKYVQKIAKEFANPEKLKKIVEAAQEIGGEVIATVVEKVTDASKNIADGLDTAGRWLGENGYAFYEKNISPAVQRLSVEGQKQFAQGMKAFQEIKTGIMTSTATDFAQGYKGKFKEMYGGAVQSATDQIKKIPGLDPAKVDALVTQVTTELEKQFDNAAKTVQDINDKGAGNVLKGFIADLRVVGGDAYEKNIAPMVANLQEGGQKLAAEGMQMLKAVKESTATEFGKGYKEQFAKMYGPKIEQAKDLLVKAGLDKGKVDQFVGDVTAGIEKGFDKGVQTVQDINDKGAGNVLKGFVADLGVVGGDAYEKYLRPSVDSMKEGGRQLMANGMQVLKEIKTGVMTSTTQDFAKGYKEQFQGLYGAKIEQAKGLLVQAGLDKAKVDQFVGDVTSGIEKQFDAGVKTVTEIQQKGVVTVLKEFSSDMGIVAETGFNDYIKPFMDKMDAKARPHVEVAMRELATLREGALQLIAQDPKQTAEEYAQRLQKAYGPAIEAARTELAQAGITPDNARKFLDATIQSAKDGYQKVASRVQRG